jgi:hypothetical protein
MITEYSKKYNRTISILNKLMLDKEYCDYFKTRTTYTPLIIVRIHEPRRNPYEDQPNLIINDDKTYWVDIRNTPLFTKRENIIPKVKSKYSFDINLLQEKEFVEHLQKNKVYVKTMNSYLNGYFETYLMIYISDKFKKFDFNKDFDFLMLSNPESEIESNNKCIIS